MSTFKIKDLKKEQVASLVFNKGMPLIVEQEFDDGEKMYAVVAKDNSLRVICATCFKEGMSLRDESRCRLCSSFSKHFEMKDGQRKKKCTGEVAAIADKCLDIVVPDLSSDADLVEEVEKRGLAKFIAERLSDDDLVDIIVQSRGIQTLIGAKPYQLIHELRRQKEKSHAEDYYGDERKRGYPHESDNVGVELIETIGRNKRPKRTLWEPQPVTAYGFKYQDLNK
jgi:hypothetical protein